MNDSVLSQPPMAWRLCGNQVKLWRTEAGVTREELGREAGYGEETVKSMEQGRRRPTPEFLLAADQMFGARGKLIATQEYLQPDPFVPYAKDFMVYEAEALAINSFQPLLIPGLLQTEDTMRTLFNTHWPPVDDEWVEEKVKGRLARQAILKTQTKMFTFAIGEPALCNTLGCPEAHKRQLLHMLEVGEQRNVVIQVVQFNSASAALDGSFLVLETPKHERIAYEEGQTGSLLHSNPEKVSALVHRYAMIAQSALSPEESAKFIRELVERL
ncbi:helix-turn-helix domain-containing protein [Streptomyces roseoverticillatus]|uniref:helix-turn-helix domain-containing protein n=1 Tax=Streptomyces roseoverticillatus TaxID=66429 RepID=UPI000AF9939E|nr:helix-turn-helix transcriptional regulator [Streptomyces roseoverticillatus]